MTSVSAGHIILTPNQIIGSGRPQRESNPGTPHQKSRALPTELLNKNKKNKNKNKNMEREKKKKSYMQHQEISGTHRCANTKIISN